MAVSKRLRYEVLRRDNHACRYCGGTAPDVKLTVDHVVPKALGGTDEASNLVTACDPCNSGKSSSSPDQPLVDDVASDALRWAQARKVTIEQWRQHRADLAATLTRFVDAWDAWGIGEGDTRQPIPRDPGWEDSCERWLDEGFTVEDLISLIPKAMHNKPTPRGGVVKPGGRWAYYCGVVWRTLDDIGDRTKGRLDSQTPPGNEPPPVDDAAIQERLEDAHVEGFKDALDWLIGWAERSDVRTRRSCGDCGEHSEYETTGRCLWCWRRDLDPRHKECPECFRLVRIGEECPHLPADMLPPATRPGICPMCNEPLELPLDECPSCGFEIPYPSNVHLPHDGARAKERAYSYTEVPAETFPSADPKWG